MSIVKVDTLQDRNGNPLVSVANGVASGSFAPVGSRNRIINGDMRIDQRNAGAAVTVNDATPYTLDRWVAQDVTSGVFTVERTTTAPAGFTNSLKATITTADGSLSADERAWVGQRIEGFNVADLGFGSSSAKTITISFWVRSSLTGTFGGSIANGDFNRSYPFTYSISSANTFEYKTLIIPGDTTGTWLTDSGQGLVLYFSLGAGSNLAGTAGSWAGAGYRGAIGETQVIGTINATWYVTGVQLEAGTVATPFERRQFGQELALCQRYYYKIFPNVVDANLASGPGVATTTTAVTYMSGSFPVTMRIAPTALEQSGTASDYQVAAPGVATTNLNAVPTFLSSTTEYAFFVRGTVASGLTAGQMRWLECNTANAFLAWSAEL